MQQEQVTASSRANELMPIYRQDGGPSFDRIEVVRWIPGILPEIARAVGFDTKSLRDLPSWFKFLVNATNGTIIQPAFDFLARIARTRGERARETCNAYAYDLRSYFEFCASRNYLWHEITQPQIVEFVQVMACADLADDPDEFHDGDSRVGPQAPPENSDDDLALSHATIRRRVASLRSFYAHAFPGKVVFDKNSARNAGRRPDELVRPIPPEELRTFLSSLGPRPSEWSGQGTSRLWCCCVLSLTAGLRRIEVCGLDVDQFRAIRLDASEPNREHAITLRVTKGGRRRTALLPGWLVEELLIFIDGERSASRTQGGIVEPLFVNHRHAVRSPNSRIRPATLSYDFRNAMLAADMRRMNPAFRYGTGASTRLHTFHDLRHTCACLLYTSYSGSRNPWIEVQNRLGHTFLKTTIDVYLRFVNEMQDGPIDPRQSIVREMLS